MKWTGASRLAVGFALLLSASTARGAEVVAPPDLPQPRIVNGLMTTDFPTVGALLIGGNPLTASSHCSGTLIGCETFLTAGHCVSGDLNPSHYTVFLQHAGLFPVSSIALHPAYAFPEADVAVVKLGTPVRGIHPSAIDTAGGHANGTPGTIVGFGRSGGSAVDYGLKRYGAVSLAACAAGVSNTTSICWNFETPLGPPGTDSNTCNADSGGPLFLDVAGSAVVAGVTSGGDSFTCLADDKSFDARVSAYAAYIQQQGGADLNDTSCGGGAQVGDSDVEVSSFSGSLSSATPQVIHSFDVAAGVQELRIAANGVDNGANDFDLYVRYGAAPTTAVFDCASTGSNQFSYCAIDAPAAGTWFVLMDRYSGSGPYQVTATRLGTFCTAPENEGQPCDDGNACTGDDTCAGGICAGTALADATPCDDADPCTPVDSCQSGQCVGATTCGDGVVQSGCEECDDGGTESGDGCDAACAVETCFVCSGSPSLCGPPTGCRVAGKGVLIVKDVADARKDRLLVKWMRGDATLGDLGNPALSSRYSLCLREGGELLSAAVVEPGGTCGSKPCWRTLGGRGFKYRNKSTNDDGVFQVLLKTGTGNAKLLWKARGANLALPGAVGPNQYFAQPASVAVQIVEGDGNSCWETTLSEARTNRADQFKAVGP